MIRNLLCELMVREWVCVSSLAVEFLFGELGLGFGLVGFAVVFTLLAFWGRVALGFHVEPKADARIARTRKDDLSLDSRYGV